MTVPDQYPVTHKSQGNPESEVLSLNGPLLTNRDKPCERLQDAFVWLLVMICTLSNSVTVISGVLCLNCFYFIFAFALMVSL